MAVTVTDVDTIEEMLKATLEESERFPDLLVDKLERGARTFYYYYDTRGRLHNPYGAALYCVDSNGTVEHEGFYKDGVNITPTIQQLLADELITRDDKGMVYFSEAEQLTISMALGN